MLYLSDPDVLVDWKLIEQIVSYKYIGKRSFKFCLF